jgi:hypothetical protein
VFATGDTEEHVSATGQTGEHLSVTGQAGGVCVCRRNAKGAPRRSLVRLTGASTWLNTTEALAPASTGRWLEMTHA